MKHKILITGGSGFIGTNLVEQYLSKGDIVLNLDVREPRNKSHLEIWRRVDITNFDAIKTIIEDFNPDYCFHLAARTDLNGRSIEEYSANTVGVKNIIDALTNCNSLKLTIFTSSMLVCKIGYKPRDDNDCNPTTPYGKSKVESERLIRKQSPEKFPWVILRPTSIWGPWFSAPYIDFFSAIRSNMYIHPKGFRVRRSYGFVLNTVSQLEQIQINNGGLLVGRTVYIADYTPVELLEWGELIRRKFKVRRIREMPIAVFKIFAILGDVFKNLGLSFPLTSFRLKNMLTESIHDTTELKMLTGTLPYTTEEGVEITCNWMLKNG